MSLSEKLESALLGGDGLSFAVWQRDGTGYALRAASKGADRALGVALSDMLGRRAGEVLAGLRESDFTTICDEVSKLGERRDLKKLGGFGVAAPAGLANFHVFPLEDGFVGTEFTPPATDVAVADGANIPSFPDILGLIPGFVCIVNEEGKLQYTNTVLPGLTLEQVLAATIYDFVNPESKDAQRTAIKHTLETGEPSSYETTALRAPGVMGHYRTEVLPLVEVGTPDNVLLVVRDLTEQRVAETEVRAHATELERVNSELEAFSYSVSHDLRAPVRAMGGFAAILAEDHAEALDETGRDYADRIKRAAERMSALIDDLLELATVSRAEMVRASTDLSTIADELVKELRGAAPSRDIEVTIADDLAADCDPTLARQLLSNLLGNAWKFTRNKGNTVIEFGADINDGERVFFVRDNGAGFEMDYAERLFTPFQRLHKDSEFEGTGIGLATVQRIVGRHGGRVWADSKVGEGATFFFTIPERP